MLLAVLQALHDYIARRDRAIVEASSFLRYDKQSSACVPSCVATGRAGGRRRQATDNGYKVWTLDFPYGSYLALILSSGGTPPLWGIAVVGGSSYRSRSKVVCIFASVLQSIASRQ